jgi:hypothetical protein
VSGVTLGNAKEQKACGALRMTGIGEIEPLRRLKETVASRALRTVAMVGRDVLTWPKAGVDQDLPLARRPRAFV